nr:hypothetical protein [Shewanella vesiculosa]
MSKAHLTLCFGLLLLQPLADALSISIGHFIDIGEFIAIADGILAEFFGCGFNQFIAD